LLPLAFEYILVHGVILLDPSDKLPLFTAGALGSVARWPPILACVTV
jgi:hypothetical protein